MSCVFKGRSQRIQSSTANPAAKMTAGIQKCTSLRIIIHMPADFCPGLSAGIFSPFRDLEVTARFWSRMQASAVPSYHNSTAAGEGQQSGFILHGMAVRLSAIPCLGQPGKSPRSLRSTAAFGYGSKKCAIQRLLRLFRGIPPWFLSQGIMQNGQAPVRVDDSCKRPILSGCSRRREA